MASKKNMSDYKILTRKLYPSPKRVQELIPIFKIGVDGVFQLEDLPDGVDKLYDKAYLVVSSVCWSSIYCPSIFSNRQVAPL